jgi:predicted dehydrogenase
LFNIGIIGSDNSHAEIFSKIANIPNPVTGNFCFPDIRVTHIFGFDVERTTQVACNGKIEHIVEMPEEMLGKVDAVMVVFRHGDLHLQYSLPFITARIPTWIDKPFTIGNKDAEVLIRAAKENNTLITGGSTCKYLPDIATIKSAIEKGSRIGRIKTAALNFSATLNNDYGGIYFYGAHLAEMAMMAFGYDANSVIASVNNEIVTAIVNYEKYQITLSFIPDSKEYYAILYGENGIAIREIDITNCYLYGLEKFVEMLRSQKLILPLECLCKPVMLLNAVVESYKAGKEVFL